MSNGSSSRGSAPRTILIVVATAILAVAATLGVLYGTGARPSQSRQDAVAERGKSVMPFDLEKTTHVFEPLDNGGVQKVVADDPKDDDQIALIREHLKEEVEAFRRGNLSDPAEIHGKYMPGLAKLEAGAKEMEIRYSELPNGAQIEYESRDSELVLALHDWFAAQLSDHGNDATSRKGTMDHKQHSMGH